MTDPAQTPVDGASKASQRTLQVDGALNARDLGGMPAGDGRVIRRGVVVRMDSPQFVTDDGARTLLDEHGIRTVLDLRYPTESQEGGIGPLATDAVTHVNIPIKSSDEQVAPGLRQMIEAAEGRPPAEVTFEYYQGYFTASDGQAIVAAVRELVRPDALPAVVHCAAGKDRTGAVVAIALSAVGVPDEVIADDYAASAAAVAGIVRRLRDTGAYEELDESTIDMQLTRHDTMTLLLAWIGEQYGGAREFLLARGFTEDDLQRLSDVLVEDAA
ncbi:hypothetical protein EK0264_14875 [Epidermidibacterium keratini]|uniref:Tyrosine specific protein phosphatases domain-containing protein n=1 Tax=Epidermidibacterium keratini TaxID=1891644 RepID=A0A7L4YR73_9ACTN|nr:tyrosine-protein phosphatase [Epidermidibacterium keratini]QHC01443.1 hypothetical protein EK0264_14875 [Epidermidibacterium keratini]